jgi:hypothetical protein
MESEMITFSLAFFCLGRKRNHGVGLLGLHEVGS